MNLETTQLPEGIDPQRPSAARVYDFYLGGSHNFAADRAAANAAAEAMPDLPAVARVNRRFLQRAVRTVAGTGIDQFIDLGSGIPTVGNVHEVARSVRPDARVVYVDIEPVAVIHSRNILRGDPDSAVLQANMLDVEGVLGSPEVRRLIDLSRPVCLMMVAVAHFIPDPAAIVRALSRYREAFPEGSYLVMSHASHEGRPDEAERARQVYNRTTSPLVLRGRADLAALLDGWEPVEPGITDCGDWRPDPGDEPVPAEVSRSVLVVVARKR